MLQYQNKSNIENQTQLENGDFEINFMDKSRFVGQIGDNGIEKEGVFYIQDVAKYQGQFFQNGFHEGSLSFKDIVILKGQFNEDEVFQQGKITFLKNHKSIEIELVFNRVKKLIIENQEEIIGTENEKTQFVFEDGWVIELRNNFTSICLYKRFGGNLVDENRVTVDLVNKIIGEENFLRGKKKGLSCKISFQNLPFYEEYEVTEQEEMPRYYSCSANGNTYEGNLSFQQGTVTMTNKDFIFQGGVKDGRKHGQGHILFKDNCKKEVYYYEDRIAFDSLEDVFNFVSDFGCFNHEELLKAQNINMIRFMNDVVSFKGEIIKGTTQENCNVVFINGDVFEGKLKSFKKDGYGVIKRDTKIISGSFSNDELKYGVIDYGNGAIYEGKLLDYERNGKGLMVYQGENFFKGLFIGDQIHKQGGTLTFNEKEYQVYYVHIVEFDIGIFVEKTSKQLFVLDCTLQRVYDSKLIESLKESGIDIRQSLRDMKIINQLFFIEFLQLQFLQFFQVLLRWLLNWFDFRQFLKHSTVCKYVECNLKSNKWFETFFQITFRKQSRNR